MRALFHSQQAKIAGLIFFVLICLASAAASIMFGVNNYSWNTVVEAYTAFNGSNDHLIIQTTRIPRALIAVTVGASLAVAGAYMQALTKNPLASPSLFGVNSGAAFCIVLLVGFGPSAGMMTLTWVAFIGAALSAGIVYVMGSLGRDGLTPVKVTLAGSAVTAFFSSLTQGVLLTNGKAFDQVLIWLVGSVAGRELKMLGAVVPYIAIALIAAMLLSRHMNILAMGDDVAKGLGQRTVYIKLGAAVVIVILSGGSVAVAGPVVFVGIIIPHIARYLVGTDYRWVVPYCAVLGAILILLADLGSRFIAMPKEVPVGVVTALLGVPFFVYIARKGGRS
ncbi:iron ABC transporter permease [Paenibacillus doosanensis]|uniref:Siderophore transport system permease protein YfiZ n=1 Tax=Paenibacillus konkukensis TaxID=2020716 RepID=A0ABY4RJ96_9BACL|nr:MULTISPECIES: iron ABC transporter permease [Paenibacillus]MCS7464439.1 iron ABC transporter permease [Paenibacillus doosanensis]UQZ81694.1 putative siderophore transport system permease protein YfiZ precursor [Paenibacillus konkukensis]